jgi:hypothetical protein
MKKPLLAVAYYGLAFTSAAGSPQTTKTGEWRVVSFPAEFGLWLSYFPVEETSAVDA